VKFKLQHVVLLLAVLLAAVPHAAAQTDVRIRVGALDMSEFPLMSTVIDVRDAGGFFVSGLQPSDVRILEDGNEVPTGELTEIRPGAPGARTLGMVGPRGAP